MRNKENIFLRFLLNNVMNLFLLIQCTAFLMIAKYFCISTGIIVRFNILSSIDCVGPNIWEMSIIKYHKEQLVRCLAACGVIENKLHMERKWSNVLGSMGQNYCVSEIISKRHNKINHWYTETMLKKKSYKQFYIYSIS